MILFQETICKTLCNQTMNYIHVACALRWQISIPAFIPSKLIAKASTSLSKLPCGMNQLVQRLNSAFADLLCVVFHTRNSIFYFAMSETKNQHPKHPSINHMVNAGSNSFWYAKPLVLFIRWKSQIKQNNWAANVCLRRSQGILFMSPHIQITVVLPMCFDSTCNYPNASATNCW